MTPLKSTKLVSGAVTIALVALTFTAGPAHAQGVLVVNSVDDTTDLTGCDASQCTLREAIGSANAVFGPDTIHFVFPDSLHLHTIALTSPLPEITDMVTIDGSGSSADINPPVVIDATNANYPSGIIAFAGSAASHSVVNRLTIQNGAFSGVLVHPDSGGVAPSDVQITKNYLGTDWTGVAPAPNNVGVTVNKAQNTMIEGNLISGNSKEGVFVISGGTATVQGNFIGVGTDGTSPLGNGRSGIGVYGGSPIIGGDDDAQANVIAYNGSAATEGFSDDGISLLNDVKGVKILRNSIFSNTDLGIDLDNDGTTRNDVNDIDEGSNNLQNFPVLTSAKPNVVKGTLNSSAGKRFVVQIFASDQSANRQGKTFLGEVVVKTDRGGNAAFKVTPTQTLPVGALILSTATNPRGCTSEFSRTVKVAPAT